ncbi:MAG: PA2778 family cysteine peptidase [Pseudohongiellaceae bacterium]|nr:PA2778 family cysteine peptidase [Pseudohongiellaceae bacterium]
MKMRHAIFALLISMSLIACAGAPQSKALLNSYTSQNLLSLNSTAVVLDVPFNPQQDYQCGPAAIATVLQFSGVQTSTHEMIDAVYVPARQGSLQVEMLAAPRQYDRLSYVIQPSLEVLLAQIDAGKPVLVMQNLGISTFPQWHYAVAIGYDLNEKEIILHSGLIEQYRLKLSTFERTWARADHWGVVLLTPGELPVAANELAYLESLVGYETVGSGDLVLQAYIKGVERWPNNETLGIGLGNAYFSQSRYGESIKAYEKVIDAYPNSAAAHNNLAQSLLQLGRLDDAANHARLAVNIGGQFQAHYVDTLNSILAKATEGKQ